MAEGVDNLVLEQLRLMREDMQRMEAKVDTLAEKIEDVDSTVNGLSVILVNFGGNIHNMDERIGHIEEKLGIEQ